MMTEPSEALKAYSEQTEAWERLGILADAPEYEEWLEQQYAAHQREIASWHERWKRKTQHIHELNAALMAVVDADIPPWMTDYVRENNSEQSKQQYSIGWDNGVNVTKDRILIALGIKPSAEEWLARKAHEQPEA